MKNKHSIMTIIFFIVLVTFSACDINYDSDNDTILSLDKLRSLAKKGEVLSWNDFEGYPFEDIGSGLYIRKYEIEGKYHLLISGRSINNAPDNIYLVKTTGEQIDIRYDDIDSFILN
ncbi:hypothetical protein [Paenibacillus sp. IHBB 10380]|uniref:hypothetical protein n=1 Tax=Paenibacillus sp. IHBB 10380 TaxID=1566358 RepID=UPI0005CFD86E|nr:hypothetical protein [Paenibacillus sp. IHBB 10380]AJS58447.1 hypothetical protein UB51_07975 [Paenibacillus sp. IHBB 10380]